METIEPLPIIKNEPREFIIDMDDLPDSSHEEIITDIKDIDIVSHILCEDSIKTESIPTNILESKHSECVDTLDLVKTENIPFVKKENLIKAEEIGDCNDQESIEGQETKKQIVPNFSNDLNGIHMSQKSEPSEKTDFARNTLWKEVNKKIRVIEAPVIPIKPQEYITLAKDKYVCNHCQQAYKRKNSLIDHIMCKHREVATMYQCPYCLVNSKYKWTIQMHIACKHKDTNTQWFQYKYCDKCDYKTYQYHDLKRHKLIHLKPKKIQCEVENKQKRFSCDKCAHEYSTLRILKRHKVSHLKPEEIPHFYCYHCSYKCKRKLLLKTHIFRHHFRHLEVERKRKRHFCKNVELDDEDLKYRCDKCNYKTYRLNNLKVHKLTHLKPEEIQYFYCYHCSCKFKHKSNLKCHMLKHFRNEDVPFHCYICNFITLKRVLVIEHIKKHSKVEIKSEINEGSYLSIVSGTPHIYQQVPFLK